MGIFLFSELLAIFLGSLHLYFYSKNHLAAEQILAIIEVILLSTVKMLAIPTAAMAFVTPLCIFYFGIIFDRFYNQQIMDIENRAKFLLYMIPAAVFLLAFAK